MNKAIVTSAGAFPCEREIIGWERKARVKDMKALAAEHRKKSLEFARGLFIAQQALARSGGDRRSEDAAVAYTFRDFLEEVKVSPKTAYFYLKCYDPEHNKFLTPEQVSAQQKPAALPEDNAEFERMIAYAMETGTRLPGWTSEHEAEFKLRAERRRAKMVLEKWNTRRIKTVYKDGDRDYFGEAMQNARQYSKILLPGRDLNVEQAKVCEHIADFLGMIEDPGTRMSAAYGIGLRIRQLINELAAAEEELRRGDISAQLED